MAELERLVLLVKGDESLLGIGREDVGVELGKHRWAAVRSRASAQP
jgi:hypothetical protein